MFIETIKSEGLAHLSYLIGGGGEAAVIDPRRDCEIYIQHAHAHGVRITHIFETHRNEDLVSGAPILAALTGARVHHGPNAAGDVAYAETVREGETFGFGSLRLQVLETPGHTDDSLSFAVYDDDFDGPAVGVFTGDALFVGDVGRTDFYPDRAEEVAGLLYDSLQKLMKLGDQTIIYPAHGAGSVCGDNMADREFSTIGMERRTNPMLAIDSKDEFVAAKLAEHHRQPPYFRLMERLNLEGGSPADRVLTPKPLSMREASLAMDDACLVDVRGVTAFLGGHIPSSLAIPHDMVPAFAGWLLDSREKLVLVADGAEQAEAAARHLARIGYDGVAGWLTAAMPGWASAARPVRAVPVVDVEKVASRMAEGEKNRVLLDVRDQGEVEGGIIEGAKHIYLGDLPDALSSLSSEKSYTVMCQSGARATIGASLLMRAGFSDVEVFLGSMGAWQAAGHDVVQPLQQAA